MSITRKFANNAREAILWQLEAGIDECIGEHPINHLTVSAEKQLVDKSSSSGQAQIPTNSIKLSEANKDIMQSPIRQISAKIPLREVQTAGELAFDCSTLRELESVVRDFRGCA